MNVFDIRQVPTVDSCICASYLLTSGRILSDSWAPFAVDLLSP